MQGCITRWMGTLRRARGAAVMLTLLMGMALAAASGALSAPRPVQASHLDEVVSIDADVTGNLPTAIGPTDDVVVTEDGVGRVLSADEHSDGMLREAWSELGEP